MKSQPYLILASQSPRRKDLLAKAGFTFEIVVPMVEEVVLPHWTPEDCCQFLAEKKAACVVESLKKQPQKADTVVLAADTVVALGNEIFGKPTDSNDAYRILSLLSSERHRVLTGICLWPLSLDHGFTHVETTFVTMRPILDSEIRAYIESGECYGKAGAYAIQETADRFVQTLEGSFDNVVGLPIQAVKDLLEKIRFVGNNKP